jgi:hypothetical protein
LHCGRLGVDLVAATRICEALANIACCTDAAALALAHARLQDELTEAGIDPRPPRQIH